MSRVELDAIDRSSVERARQLRADADAADAADPVEAAIALGRLQAAVDILLRVIDPPPPPKPAP